MQLAILFSVSNPVAVSQEIPVQSCPTYAEKNVETTTELFCGGKLSPTDLLIKETII